MFVILSVTLHAYLIILHEFATQKAGRKKIKLT